VSEERIGDKFLRKLYEKTVNNGLESIDKDEIGKEIGIIDVQMDNLVDELASEGYIKKIGRTKIYLTVDGRKRAEI
jgi:predicted transcriptional regulator